MQGIRDLRGRLEEAEAAAAAERGVAAAAAAQSRADMKVLAKEVKTLRKALAAAGAAAAQQTAAAAAETGAAALSPAGGVSPAVAQPASRPALGEICTSFCAPKTSFLAFSILTQI